MKVAVELLEAGVLIKNPVLNDGNNFPSQNSTRLTRGDEPALAREDSAQSVHLETAGGLHIASHGGYG